MALAKDEAVADMAALESFALDEATPRDAAGGLCYSAGQNHFCVRGN